MSASMAHRAPDFHTSVVIHEIDVEVAAQELEDAGWLYVGTDAAAAQAALPVDDLKSAHDAEHTGPFRWCQSQFCRDRAREL